MTNTNIDGDDTAFPIFADDASHGRRESGLSKREYFAAVAMQGLIAMQSENWCASAEDVAMEAVQHSDALIAALNGEGQPNG